MTIVTIATAINNKTVIGTITIEVMISVEALSSATKPNIISNMSFCCHLQQNTKYILYQ